MESEETPATLHVHDYQAKVDTSRPFRSVKEAVAIFGERLLLGEMYSPFPKPNTKLSPPNYYKQSEQVSNSSRYGDEEEEESEDDDDNNNNNNNNNNNKVVMDTLKKLEDELKETKVELKLLKERESETEVALASLNAELHKNMSKLAQAEAAAAAKASNVLHHVGARSKSSPPKMREEEMSKREWMIRMEESTSLAQILSIGAQNHENNGGGGGKKEKKIMKKKPIVPLVQDLFSWKKGSSTSLRNPLYSSPHLYF